MNHLVVRYKDFKLMQRQEPPIIYGNEFYNTKTNCR